MLVVYTIVGYRKENKSEQHLAHKNLNYKENN